jgi:hypothetical protein
MRPQTYKGGHFEFALPTAFFEGDPRSITVTCIDFYRGERLGGGAMLPFLHGLLQWANSDGRTKWPKDQRTSSLTS